MKKIFSVGLVCVIIMCCFAGCSQNIEAPKTPNGTYCAMVSDTGTELTFIGESVNVKYIVNGIIIGEQEGTYTVDDSGKLITIKLKPDDRIELPEILDTLDGTFSYSIGDNYIKIANVLYKAKSDKENAT